MATLFSKIMGGVMTIHQEPDNQGITPKHLRDTPQPDDNQWLDIELEKFRDAIEADELESEVVPKQLWDNFKAAITKKMREAEIEGMKKAKSRVLRRTEIPADAKNPTLDAVVMLGEDIADIIQRDIAALEQPKQEES